MGVTGWLIYESNDAVRNKWFIEKLQKECKALGYGLELVYTDYISDAYTLDLHSTVDDLIKQKELPSFIVNRSRNFDIAYRMEALGVRLINPARVTEIGNDKQRSYELAGQLGLPYMPYITIEREEYEGMCTDNTTRSITASPEWNSLKYKAGEFGYPLVLKPIDGHGGSHVYLINNEMDLHKAFQDICTEHTRHPYSKFLIQRCANVLGRDLRIYMLGNRILSSILRSSGSAGDFRANFSLGAKASVHTLSREERFMAEELAEALPSDFIGIDLIYHNGSPVFNELEDAVGSRMLYEKTDIDAVRQFARHICSTLS